MLVQTEGNGSKGVNLDKKSSEKYLGCQHREEILHSKGFGGQLTDTLDGCFALDAQLSLMWLKKDSGSK